MHAKKYVYLYSRSAAHIQHESRNNHFHRHSFENISILVVTGLKCIILHSDARTQAK